MLYNTYSQEKQHIYQKIMNCEKTDDFKKLAIYLGAELRDKNHIFIKHFNGDVTSIAFLLKKLLYIKLLMILLIFIFIIFLILKTNSVEILKIIEKK